MATELFVKGNAQRSAGRGGNRYESDRGTCEVAGKFLSLSVAHLEEINLRHHNRSHSPLQFRRTSLVIMVRSSGA